MRILWPPLPNILPPSPRLQGQVEYRGMKWLLPLLCGSLAFSVDDSIHYVLQYRSTEDKGTTHKGLFEDNDERVTIISRNSEQYTCKLPELDAQPASYLENYKGQTPWELISKLKEQNLCSKRIEQFWSYELCHGRYVLQYHEDKMARSQYYLGNFHQNYVTLKWDPRERKTITVNEEELVYLPVLYSQGTTCDITGQPRTAKVLYVCYKGARELIESVTEISSCQYEVVILTDLLCSHPAFTGKQTLQHPIVCTLNEERQHSAPKGLIDLNAHHKSVFHQQYSKMTTGFGPVDNSDADTDSILDSLYQDMEQKKRLEDKAKTFSDQNTELHSALAFSTEMILKGEECLEGGIGWWKYELCVGKQVTQFHEEGNERTTVLLGEFDVAFHKAWIKNNPSKLPHKYSGKVVQITHIYNKGDICEETKAERSVEVRIRCPKQAGSSPLAVAISLSEPALCEYILTLEGERFCQSLQKVDEYGLLP